VLTTNADVFQIIIKKLLIKNANFSVVLIILNVALMTNAGIVRVLDIMELVIAIPIIMSIIQMVINAHILIYTPGQI
jgi:hypothetical protein